MAIVVVWGTVPAYECCCGDPGHARPPYEAWIATDSDYPGFRVSTTRSAGEARRELAEIIDTYGDQAVNR